MKVSIVVPTYKRPDYLDRLLKSILMQRYQNYEVIVVDDNSPNYDEYVPIIKKYEQLFADFRFLRNDINKGAPYSRNRGILESRYDLIALVDDDDEWLPSKLGKQVQIFAANDQSLGLVYTWTDAVDANDSVVHQYRSELAGYLKKEILCECFIPSPSVMVRKEAILAAGLFDESFPSCQDWDMWTRLILRGYRIDVLKESVAIYHKHNSNNIGSSQQSSYGYIKFFKKHFLSTVRHCDMCIVFRRIKAILVKA